MPKGTQEIGGRICSLIEDSAGWRSLKKRSILERRIQQNASITLPCTCSSLPRMSFLSRGHHILVFKPRGAEHRALVTNPRGGCQTLLPIASWNWSCQGKHNMGKHWMEQCFIHIEKRQSKTSFSPRSSLVGSAPPCSVAMRGSWPARSPLSCCRRSPT